MCPRETESCGYVERFIKEIIQFSEHHGSFDPLNSPFSGPTEYVVIWLKQDEQQDKMS